MHTISYRHINENEGYVCGLLFFFLKKKDIDFSEINILKYNLKQ